MIGSRIFLAPLSRQHCRVFAGSSTFIFVPLMLISPRTARLSIVDRPNAMEHSAISWAGPACRSCRSPENPDDVDLHCRADGATDSIAVRFQEIECGVAAFPGIPVTADPGTVKLAVAVHHPALHTECTNHSRLSATDGINPT